MSVPSGQENIHCFHPAALCIIKYLSCVIIHTSTESIIYAVTHYIKVPCKCEHHLLHLSIIRMLFMDTCLCVDRWSLQPSSVL